MNAQDKIQNLYSAMSELNGLNDDVQNRIVKAAETNPSSPMEALLREQKADADAADAIEELANFYAEYGEVATATLQAIGELNN